MGYHHRLSGFICRARNQPPSYREDIANRKALSKFCCREMEQKVINYANMHCWWKMVLSFLFKRGPYQDCTHKAFLNCWTSQCFVFTLCADKTVVRGFGWVIDAIFPYGLGWADYQKNCFLVLTQSLPCGKNEHLSPIPMPLSTELSAQSGNA